MRSLLDNRVDPFAWDASVAPGLEPRLFAELPPNGSMRTLAAHRIAHPVPPRPRHGGDARIIDEVELAGLTGRGGAEFPTAKKWKAVAEGHRPVVVVNGAEGEPLAGKDAMLMARVPHLVIDGALFAAAAVGADRVFLCVGDHAAPAIIGMERALEERRHSERGGVKLELRLVPDRYVAGEGRALVHWLNGGEPVPTVSPPHTSERGVHKRPTLVQNAETLAHVALIMAHGATWYRSAGTVSEPGTRLISLTGALPRPVVSEVEAGVPLLQVFEDNGGDPGDVSGVLIGGFYGHWLTAGDAFDAHLSKESLTAIGANPGCGIVHFLPKEACGVAAITRIAEWFSRESAGQCGPCVFGLEAIAGALRSVDASVNANTMLARVDRWTREIPGRGGCKLPDGASAMVRTGLDVFAEEVDVHRSGHCSAWLAAVEPANVRRLVPARVRA